MRWEGNRRSTNVEDRRGGGGGRGGLPIGGGSIGIGTLVIALIGGALLGVNPLTLLGILAGGEPAVEQPAGQPPADDRMAQFVSTVLADTEDVWNELFRQGGANYQEPRLVLFRGSVRTACGAGQSAMGPFYCPADQKVYLDLSFWDELASRFGAQGEAARAYVIAHEIGHHVQHLTGKTETAQRLGMRGAESGAVRLELQADCYAGVWVAHAARVSGGQVSLDPRDIEDGIRAAAAVGDDALQKKAQGRVMPDAFTHGTSEQRMRWFRRGVETGDPDACDTFSARTL